MDPHPPNVSISHLLEQARGALSEENPNEVELAKLLATQPTEGASALNLLWSYYRDHLPKPTLRAVEQRPLKQLLIPHAIAQHHTRIQTLQPQPILEEYFTAPASESSRRSFLTRANLLLTTTFVIAMIGSTLRGEQASRMVSSLDENACGLQMRNQIKQPGLAGSDLRQTNLAAANLCFAALQGANLQGANLQGANLEYAVLTNADLRASCLREADLRGADLTGANLVDADLTHARYNLFTKWPQKFAFQTSGAIGPGANFEGADLQAVSLQEANLAGANLHAANLAGANLEATNFTGADLTGANLAEARYNAQTQWPEDFEVETSGAIGITPTNEDSSDASTQRG